MILSRVRSRFRPSANKYHFPYFQVIEKLTATNKNFRYIVNVTLVAKGGNGLDIGGLSYWNGEMDGSTTLKWESKYLTCIATVYGIAN
jgi:hypothetical protein